MTDNIQIDELASDWIRPIDDQTIRELSRLRPGYAVLATIADWSVLVAVIAVSWRLWSLSLWIAIPAYLLAVVVIGARQHALGVLMHDGAHYRIFPNRFWNELFSQVCLSWPMLMDVRSYRRLHFGHHCHLNTSDDPDWVTRDGSDWEFPKTRGQLAGMFLNDLLLFKSLFMVRYLFRYVDHRTTERSGWDLARLVFMGVLVTAFAYCQLWLVFLLYWIVPMLTSLKAILRMRIIAEHYALEYDQESRRIRTTIPRWWERLLISPHGINYHIEHHLYPSIPFYSLPRLHRELQAIPEFAAIAHVSCGYSQVLRECMSCEQQTVEPQVPECAAKLSA